MRARCLRRIRTASSCTGTIDEKAIGSIKGKILDKIARDYGSDCAREFLDSVTSFAIGAIMVKGFSTGIDDEDIPKESQQQIEDMLQDAIEQVDEFVTAYRKGELEQMPGRSPWKRPSRSRP